MTSFSSRNEEFHADEHANPAYEGGDETDSNGAKIPNDVTDMEEDTHDDRQRNGNSDIESHPQDISTTELAVGDELEIEENAAVRCIVAPLQAFGNFVTKHKNVIEVIFIVLLILFYIGYMIAALIRDFDRAVPLLVIFCLVLFFQAFAFVKDHWGDSIWNVWEPIYRAIGRNIYWLKWVFIAFWLALLGVWIGLDTVKRPQQLISLAGYVLFVFLLWVLGSKFPAKVRWRPVFWGLGIQMVLGVIVLRTTPGYNAFNWLGNLAATFLDYVDAGSEFLFGEVFREHYFAFKVLPIIIYFSAFISILYYLGAMQWLIFKIAWLMQFSLGTSGTESMCAAGNIFVGQVESPLLIRPYIKDLTTSEMFAVMTAGFGTIAGSVLGAYLGFGIEPVYVITACVMAAPCALAIAKLMYPETKKSKFMTTAGLQLDPPDQRNIVEAAFVGASSALPLVLNIGANLIAFISLLAALNGFLNWYGKLLDFDDLSFELICSYVFLPITYMMGIEWQDCFKCAELLGIKIFLNEFIAYEELAVMIANKENGTIPREDDDGTTNWISDRSEAIITYALCGFANVGSLGIMLGGLTSMCPERQSEMAKIVIRALTGGIFVSILNACVAGFFYEPSAPNCTAVFGFTSWDATEEGNVYRCCEDEVAVPNITSADYCRCCAYAWSDDFDALSCPLTC